MKHIILDKTANNDRIYINSEGDNCELIENAEVFESKENAEQKINDNNWQNWAGSKPLEEC